MPTKPVRADTEKLRAFEQRMSHEGAAGFAAGPTPWENWDDSGSADSWRGTAHDTERVTQPRRPHTPRKPLGHRVVTSIARLSVLALGIGIAGVYFSSGTEPQLAMNGIRPAPIVTHGTTSNTAALAIAESQPHGVVIDPDTLPAPAAGRPEITVVKVTGDMQEGPADAQASTGNADSAGDASAPAVMPDSGADTTATAPAQQTARPAPDETLAAVQQQPAAITATVKKATPATGAKTATAAQPASGVWVVNLASYNHESIAQRMLEEFRDKGVEAELVKVTVNDRPMVRIRTTGYGSLREASDWAALLEERLELDGAWVSRR